MAPIQLLGQSQEESAIIDDISIVRHLHEFDDLPWSRPFCVLLVGLSEQDIC